jgi:Rps23 Pro-64 3,4-dihydroxylase Tpa1-like proline 4-hydroxylase
MLKKKSLISQKYQNITLLKEEEKELIRKGFPWTHFILDNFIEEKPFKRMQRTFLSKKHKFLVKENDPYFVQYTLLRYLPLAKVFYSLEFKNILEKFSGFKLSLNTSNYVQVRYMNQSSPELPIHVDTLEGTAVIAIYYLSPEWTKESGGELCLYDEFEENIPKMLVEPLENRLIFFPSNITTWHSIKKVNCWERYSILSTWNIKS